MKIYLCLGVLYKLMQGKRVSASCLSKQFEVSTRTIYRAIENLTLAGFKITSFSGKNGGYELFEQKLTNYLSKNDLLLLQTAVNFLPKNAQQLALKEKLNSLILL